MSAEALGALEVLRTKALKWRWRTDVARCVLTPRCTGAPLPAGCHLCRGFAPSQSRHPPESQARIHLPLLPTHLAPTLTPSRRKRVAPVEAKARRARRGESALRPSRHDLARSYAILRDKSRSCKNSARPGVSCSCTWSTALGAGLRESRPARSAPSLEGGSGGGGRMKAARKCQVDARTCSNT